MKKLISFCLVVFLFFSCSRKKDPPIKGEMDDIVVIDTAKYLITEHIESHQFGHQKKNEADEEVAFPIDDFYSKYDTVIVEREIFYIVEGDLFYDIDQLHEYESSTKDTLGNKLVINELNGSFIKWPDNKVIKYAIIRSSFNSQSEYDLIKSNMTKAVEGWSSVCNVTLEHISSLDEVLRPSQTHDNLDFVVRQYNAGGKFIAKAFFPDYPKHRKKVFIDPSYYTASFNKVGILRHELGHVLGFRHEHIRSGAPASCPKNESTVDTRILTEYDPKSVMHYFCGNEGTRELTISKIDSIGAVLVYGASKKIGS